MKLWKKNNLCFSKSKLYLASTTSGLHTTDPSPCHKANKRSYQQAFYDNRDPLDESELDDVAEQISRRWKNVGRKLDLTESCLNEIDLRGTSPNVTEREKSFQMLMEWRERFPETFTRGRLHSVLDQCDLKYTAKRLFVSTKIK